MQAAKAKRKSCEFWLSFTVWTEWSLNSYLIAFAALRRIHRFRWCIEFHFKHWIIAVSDNCKVIVSQHFDPWNYNIRCQNLTHFSASLSTVKFVVWPRKVFFQALKSWPKRLRWADILSNLPSVRSKMAVSPIPRILARRIFPPMALPGKNRVARRENLCKLLSLICR